MKILQVVYSLAPGGAERFVVDLTNQLSKSDELMLVTFLKDEDFFLSLLSKDVNYSCLNQPRGFKINIIFLLEKIIKKFKPDIIHCHLSTIFYLAPLATPIFQHTQLQI